MSETEQEQIDREVEQMTELAHRLANQAMQEIGDGARVVVIVAREDVHTNFGWAYRGPCAAAEGLTHILLRRLVKSFPPEYQ